MKQKFYLITVLILLTGVISISFKAKQFSCKSAAMNYPNGAAFNLGAGFTGASWDNGGSTCAEVGCHQGGSFNPSTTIKLLNGLGTAVTEYTPGVVYTLRMTVVSTSGTPKYGFDIMCATAGSNTNINTWATSLTALGARNTSMNSRNYIEQISARTATSTGPSTYILNVPWTGPTAGTGSVTFYAEGMAVNGTGNENGDSPASPVNLTIHEYNAVAPVKISLVTAQKASTGINVSWVSEQEINVDHYIIEHSTDGSRFEALDNVSPNTPNAGQRQSYNYLHTGVTSGRHYYRIVEVDLNGAISYSQVASVSLDRKRSFNVAPNPVTDIVNLPIDQFNGSNYVINSVNGRKVITGKIQESKIDVAKLPAGVYILTVVETNGNIQTSRFIKE